MNEPLPSLERLGAEFERVVRAQPRRRALRRRTVLFAAAGALLVSAVALAASGALTGAPVKNPAWFPKPRPHVAGGVVRPASVTLTALRVPDPAGGPPWGLRTMTTTRALGCVQIGRIVDGRLGVLGQDHAFGDDGRFHELPPDVESGRDCEPLDGAGRLFLATSYQGMPSSGYASGCSARTGVTLCPHEDLRIVYYGTLGPQARSVTYEDHGVLRTAPTSGPLGAYLIVAQPDRQRPARGYFVPGTSPASGLEAVTYRDGHTCHIPDPRRLGGAKACPRVGYVAARGVTPHRAQLATRVSASFAAAPVAPPGPGGKSPGIKSWALRVAFTARAAAGPRSFYFVTLTLPGRSCGNVGGVMTSPIARDVAAGDRVRTTLFVPLACRGTVGGDLRFQATTGERPAPFESANPRRTPVVGTYRVQIPPR